MPTVDIGDVIAERRLTFQPPDGVPQHVTVRIGRPVLDTSAPHETWICPFQIEGIGSGRRAEYSAPTRCKRCCSPSMQSPLNSPCASETQAVSFCILANPTPASSRRVEWRS